MHMPSLRHTEADQGQGGAPCTKGVLLNHVLKAFLVAGNRRIDCCMCSAPCKQQRCAFKVRAAWGWGDANLLCG
jgi:hypothetical protein